MKISNFIENLKPYVPGKSIESVQREYGLKKITKLASNENSLGPSLKVLNAIKKASKESHLYPDGSYFQAKDVLTQYFSKKYNHTFKKENFVLGNGSNELIDMLIRVFCEPKEDEILTSAQSFVAYKVCAHVNRCSIVEVPLNKDFGIDVERLCQSLTPKHRIIFIPNPNNPTGKYLNHREISYILDKVKNRDDILVVLDEAYTEYVQASDYPKSIELFKSCKNLVILRTFAKAYGIAGLRVGVLIAHPHITQVLEKVRLPFNISNLGVAAMEASLGDSAYIRKSQKMVWNGLKYFYKELNKMGLPYCTSQGNFIFFDTKVDSSLVFEECLKKGLILRPVKNYGFATHLRMTVGTSIENRFAIQTLKSILKK